MRDMLFGDKLEKRDKWMKLVSTHPIFESKYNLTLDQERQLAYQRLKVISENKLFSIFDFDNDPVNLFTCHE